MVVLSRVIQGLTVGQCNCDVEFTEFCNRIVVMWNWPSCVMGMGLLTYVLLFVRPLTGI